MKYIYKNVTNVPATVLLATKNQDSITTCVFSPNASIELDYPGLNMYVPNPLSCIIIEHSNMVQKPEVAVEPVKVVVPKAVEPVIDEGPKITEDEITDIINSGELLEPAAGEPFESVNEPTLTPVVDTNFALVPPPAPSIQVIKPAAKAPIKPAAKTKPGKKN
ncbi:MAG: hypothetical protein JHC33_05110 [Ignisphaera sp.]|nr:hypothetical protein [Ignisphaera sp.]